MKLLIYILILTIAVIAAARMGLFRGKTPANLGAIDGKLAPPKIGSQNSIGSQHTANDYHSIAPIKYTGDPSQAMAKLALAIGSLDGLSIVRNDGNYIYAQAQTKWMQYIDDVEFLLSPGEQVIHVRSASRLGRKDFGVNRARIEAIRRKFSAA
jgi:uncharacterized protein (DUF1499 family)